MSKRVAFVFPHQLFLISEHPALRSNPIDEVWLVEHDLFFTQHRFHTHKLILHRASLKWYESYLADSGRMVRYFESDASSTLTQALQVHKVDQVHVVDVVDDWLWRDVTKICTQVDVVKHNSPQFVIPSDEVGNYQDVRLLESFYRKLRKQLDILMDGDQPEGGKWNYDHSNREALPKNHTPTKPRLFGGSHWVKEAAKYVKERWPNNPGRSDSFWVPVTRDEALEQLTDFLDHRLQKFGPYEDAMHTEDGWVYHSTISSALNCGLLTPAEVLRQVEERYYNHNVPIESAEAVIRQIMGWREFMRVMYVNHGQRMRTSNFFKHTKQLPDVFWKPDLGKGTPLGPIMDRVHRYAYAHHIERLMVLGNVALLTESHPDTVYQWFMEFFIDAYDWVMVPNVYDMSQFASGGIFATKPYISGAAYLKKMGNFAGGDWEAGWTGLYWSFIHRHLGILEKNHRMGLICAQAKKQSTEKKSQHFESARLLRQSLCTGAHAK